MSGGPSRFARRRDMSTDIDDLCGRTFQLNTDGYCWRSARRLLGYGLRLTALFVLDRGCTSLTFSSGSVSFKTTLKGIQYQVPGVQSLLNFTDGDVRPLAVPDCMTCCDNVAVARDASVIDALLEVALEALPELANELPDVRLRSTLDHSIHVRLDELTDAASGASCDVLTDLCSDLLLHLGIENYCEILGQEARDHAFFCPVEVPSDEPKRRICAGQMHRWMPNV